MELEIPNPVFELDFQDGPIKLDEVTSSLVESLIFSCLTPQCFAKKSDTSLVGNANHAEEDLDPTQLDFLAQYGICPEDRQPSPSVFKFVSTRRHRRASKHHLTSSRRPVTRSMDATSYRRRSKRVTNKVNVCSSQSRSRRKRKVDQYTLTDDIPHSPSKKRIGLYPP